LSDVKGLIHSIEPFGTVDGPGVRMVLFLAGCPMKCLFCHNPEIAAGDEGQLYTPRQVLDRYNKNKSFYQKGGLTFSGGEPLLQGEFVTQCVRLLKENKVHIAVDTSLCCGKQWVEGLIPFVDLWMVSIKAATAELHQELTGHSNAAIINNIISLNRSQANMLIRYVIIPGYTDEEKELSKLAEFIRSLPFVPPLELLAYHTMGVHKWRSLDLIYRLARVPDATKQEMERAKEILRANGIADFVQCYRNLD
jgi:pyruvate formate lyase activating enzyme